MTKPITKPALGPCRFGCGRKATIRKHNCCDTCYPSCRVWSNVKSPEERAAYMNTLLVRQRRVAAVTNKEIVIGTSPFTWRAPAEKLAPPSMRRQRSNVR